MHNNIREIRVKKGMGIRKLSELANIDKSMLSKIERGLYPLYPNHKARIEIVLGEPVSETK